MHLFRGANNCIDRTRLNAEGATNAFLWIYKSNRARALYAALWINSGVQLKCILWINGYQHFTEALDTLHTTRRAAIG
jgi:hypothetical protein